MFTRRNIMVLIPYWQRCRYGSAAAFVASLRLCAVPYRLSGGISAVTYLSSLSASNFAASAEVSTHQIPRFVVMNQTIDRTCYALCLS